MIPFVNDINMVPEAQALTLSQFQDSPLFLGMIRAMITPLQDIQDTLYAILTQTYVSNAVGVALDSVGLYVGIMRNGFTDAVFRLFIYVQIAINNSDGTPNEIIEIMELITGATNVLYSPYYPAALSLQVNVNLNLYLATIGLSANRFVELIRSIIPVGVLLYGISAYDGPHNAFGFFEDPDALGFDDGNWAYDLY